MQKLRTKASVAAGSLLCWLIFLSCVAMRSNAQETEDGIVGTWTINVTAAPTFSVCTNPAVTFPGPPPFVELATYADGGTMEETNTELNANSLSTALHLNGSDGHGVWKDQTRDRVKTHFRKLLFDGIGDYVGNADLLEEITVQHHQLSGNFKITVTFLNGDPSLCGSGTISGIRMTLE